jgi:hypothetical protein
VSGFWSTAIQSCYTIYAYIAGKYKIYLYKLKKQEEKSEHFIVFWGEY